MKKIISLATFCLLIFIFALSTKCLAQALTPEAVKEQLVKDWERAKIYTVEYLNAMPADKYTFKANDSVRSFAQHMLHLAQSSVLLISTATDQEPLSWIKSDPQHSPTAEKKDSVMYYVTASYDYCINAIKNADVNKWNEKKKIFSYEETRFAIINKAFEHQTHHRGQTTIYIRLQGIKPPQERLFR